MSFTMFYFFRNCRILFSNFAFYWDNLGSFIYMEVYNFNHNKLEGGNYFE